MTAVPIPQQVFDADAVPSRWPMYMYISIKLWRYFINFVGKVVNLFGYAIWAAAVTLVIASYPKEVGISYVHSLWQDLSMGTKIFDLVTLTFGLLLKNFNLGHSFLTRRGRAFILHMYIRCDKTFPWLPKFLTLWPWPWSLTYFYKTLTLAIAS